MVVIPNMEKPKGCWDCFNYDCEKWGEHGYDNSTDCPLIEIVTCGECRKVDTKKCPMYSAGWGYTNDDWCSEGERRADERITE